MRGVDVVAVVESGLKHEGVGLVDGRLFGEFVLEMAQGRFERTVEEPAHKPEGKDVAAFEDALVVESAFGEGRASHRRHGHFYNLSLDAEFLKGFVGGEEGFAEIGFLEGVDVHDNHTSRLEKAYILFQSRGVHGYQHVACVARGMHSRAYAHLKARDSAERALRGPDFRRIVREGRHEVAKSGRYIRKNIACKLHAVAGVAGEAHNDLVKLAHLCFFQHGGR